MSSEARETPSREEFSNSSSDVDLKTIQEDFILTGIPLEFIMGDVMPTYLSAGIGYEVAVYDEIQKQVRPGMQTAVIGAHWGHFVQVMLQLGAHVTAFEPDPDNFKELKERCPMATVHNLAGLDRDEDLPLHIDLGNSGNHTLFAHGAIGAPPGPIVKARRLEAFLPQPLDFCLIDAQGCDHLALEGLGDKRPPVAIVEHWEHGLTCSGMDPTEVLESYRRMGYYPRKLDDLNYVLLPG